MNEYWFNIISQIIVPIVQSLITGGAVVVVAILGKQAFSRVRIGRPKNPKEGDIWIE